MKSTNVSALSWEAKNKALDDVHTLVVALHLPEEMHRYFHDVLACMLNNLGRNEDEAATKFLGEVRFIWVFQRERPI